MRGLLLVAVVLSGCASTRGALGKETILEDRDMVWSLALSPDGSKVAVVQLTGLQFVLRLFEATGARRWQAALNPSAHDVEAVEFSPDGTRVATAGQDGAVRLFDAATGAPLGVQVLDGPLRALAFHPDGARLAVGGADGVVSVLAADGLAVLAKTAVHQGAVRALAFGGDGRLFSGGEDKALAISTLEPSGAASLGRRFVFAWFVNDLVLDGPRLAIAFSREKDERTPQLRARELRGDYGSPAAGDCAVLFDLVSSQQGACVPFHRGAVTTAAVRPRTGEVVSGGWDRDVILETRPSRVTRTLGWAVRRVRFSKDGRRLAVAAWTPQNATGARSAPAALVIELE